MSGLTGKGSLSIKKQEVAQSRLPAVSFRKVRALHKCTLGQTIINLTSLTSPSVSEAKNYSAPNPSLLASINAFEMQDNVTVKSSIRGELLQNVSFVVSGASTIELQFEAEENEILEITIDNVARTGATLVDARPLVVTGTLAAGETDFNVGEPFKVGEHPLAQHGAVMVMVDNQPMYRNTNNQAPGAGVTGDYYEVHAGGGLGTIIRFNVPDLVNDRTVSVISIGALVERPMSSQMALVEAVQGQIDAMIPTLAALAGVDETDFQAQPNNVDLKAFGDRVILLERILDLEVPVVTPWTNDPSNLQIGYTGGGGTLGTGQVVNRVMWRQNGQNIEVKVEYRHTVAGSTGVGDLLVKMPNNFKIDTNLTTVYATAEGWNSNFVNNSIEGIAEGGNGTNQWFGHVVPYDQDYVRIAASDGASNTQGFIGQSPYNLGQATLFILMKFSIPVQGLTATQTVREALGL